MDKMKQPVILIFSGVLLSACGIMGEEGVPEDLEENWPQYVQEGNESLDSYASDTQIDLEMSIGPDLMTDEGETNVSMQMIGDLEQGYMIEDGYELYFEGNNVYQLEGDSWVHYPDRGPIEYDSWYPNIVDSLIEIEDLVDVAHNEGLLEFTYEGNDREVWNAFEEEFALTIDGIAEENVQMTLDATMDDSSYHLQDLSLDIVGEETDGEIELAGISIFVGVDYFDHNEVDLTEVGEEIKADAEN